MGESRDMINEKQAVLLGLLKQREMDEESSNSFVGYVSTGELSGLRERLQDKDDMITMLKNEVVRLKADEAPNKNKTHHHKTIHVRVGRICILRGQRPTTQ